MKLKFEEILGEELCKELDQNEIIQCIIISMDYLEHLDSFIEN